MCPICITNATRLLLTGLLTSGMLIKRNNISKKNDIKSKSNIKRK